jgi:hypothetical protein
VVADALSRVESITAAPSPEALAASQEDDGKLRALLASDMALRLEKQQIPGTAVSIYCDTSAGKPRPYVPGALRLQVFQSVHDLSHPGTKATALLVAQRFVWPGIEKDCSIWARACQACQGPKVSRHTVIPVGDFTLPAARFLHVHVDLVGPLPTSVGYRYCLTAVDRFTCWPTSNPNPGHHSRDRGKRPRRRLDIAFLLPADYHNGPGTSIRVATLPLPGQDVWNPALQENRPPPSSQRSGGTLPPNFEGSHHVPRGPAVNRGSSTGSPGNPHFIQGRSTSIRS